MPKEKSMIEIDLPPHEAELAEEIARLAALARSTGRETAVGLLEALRGVLAEQAHHSEGR